MPRAHGRDRLEPLDGGRVAIVCSEAKGWEARTKAPHAHRPDHPGTAVLWGDAHWEVLAVEVRVEGGVRYVLAAWDDQNVFRGMVRYDEESELVREEAKRAQAQAEARRGLLVLLAPLAGLLPEDDQLRLEHRLGVRATTMTFVSAILLFLFGTYSVIMLFAAGFGGPGVEAPPLFLMMLGDYLFIESFARLIVVMAQGRPLGSLLAFPWLLVRARRDPKPPDLSRVPDARDLREEREGTFHVLQPVLALLPEDEQLRLQQLYGFDALSWGRTTAWILLGVGLLFAGSAVLNVLAGIGSFGEALWLAAGAALVLEQRGRLARIRAGRPAGSVLGRLVRAASRKLFVD